MNDNHPNKAYSLTYYDEFGAVRHAKFKSREYHSLMELLFDKYLEEWGDCKGKGLCGTCHIKIIEGTITEKMGCDENHTLSKVAHNSKKSRLACQIPVSSELNGIVFKMMTGI